MNPSHCAPPTLNLGLSCYCFYTNSSYDIGGQIFVSSTNRKLHITETMKPLLFQFINFKYTCSSLSTLSSTEMGEGSMGVKRSSSILVWCKSFSLCRFAKQVTDLWSFLPYIIPTVVQRLGQPEIAESCEELRLYLVELLCSVTEICGEKIGVYIDDMVKILQRTLVDPFHDVRKVSFVWNLFINALGM